MEALQTQIVGEPPGIDPAIDLLNAIHDLVDEIFEHSLAVEWPDMGLLEPAQAVAVKLYRVVDELQGPVLETRGTIGAILELAWRPARVLFDAAIAGALRSVGGGDLAALRGDAMEAAAWCRCMARLGDETPVSRRDAQALRLTVEASEQSLRPLLELLEALRDTAPVHG